ncbi:hypothetical protein QN416_27295, partial [Glaciimonas sp. Cout2]|uniref:hypothetical protein n=1 Tax=Glaciimonas sp. Cout2 TaxID=3048621 RepID=UPI002B23261E
NLWPADGVFLFLGRVGLWLVFIKKVFVLLVLVYYFFIIDKGIFDGSIVAFLGADLELKLLISDNVSF